VTDEKLDENLEADASATTYPEEPPQYGVGPFTIREVALGGVWLLAFVVSFFSITAIRFESVWTSGLLWILTIGVPTAAVFLIALRRLSPDGIRRVGSLGIDQFASVAFSVSAILWLQLIWETVAIVIDGGPWVRTWVIWVSFFLMVAGVFLTVFAPFIAPFDEDFRGRPEIPAHRNARPVRAVTARPTPEPRPVAEPVPTDETAAYAAVAPAPAAAEAEAIAAADEQSWEPEHARDTFEPVETAEAAADEPGRHQAFWALAPEDRDVVDEVGIPIFRVGPTAWALVIEDRGDTFVVRHEDGRVGYLHDVEGVTRG
jgi:hypothetical protein